MQKMLEIFLANTQKATHGHKDVFPVTLSFTQKSDLQTGLSHWAFPATP